MTDTTAPERTEATIARWRAVITYRSENGPVDVEHAMTELDEIWELVERGPDWNTIENINITLDLVSLPGMTLEDVGL